VQVSRARLPRASSEARTWGASRRRRGGRGGGAGVRGWVGGEGSWHLSLSVARVAQDAPLTSCREESAVRGPPFVPVVRFTLVGQCRLRAQCLSCNCLF
jgi:hypothetical protein